MEDASSPIYTIQNMPDKASITLIARVEEICDNDVTWILQKGVLSDSSGKTRFRIFKHSNLKGFEPGKTYKIKNAVAHIVDSLEWSSIDLDELSEIEEMPDIDKIGNDVIETSIESLIPAIDLSKGFYYIIAGTATNIVFNGDLEKAYSGNIFVIIKPNNYIGVLNTTNCGYHSIKGVNDARITKVDNRYDIYATTINDSDLHIKFVSIKSVQYRLIHDYPSINNGKIDDQYREKIKEKYPNSLKRWEYEDAFDLVDKFKKNVSVFTLSDIYKRDPSAVLSKLCALNAFQDNPSTPALDTVKREDVKAKVLDLIKSNTDGVRQNTLIKTLGIDSFVCSRVLKKLEREGVITREMELENGIKSYRIKYIDVNGLIQNSLNGSTDGQIIKNFVKISTNLKANLKNDYQSQISRVLDHYPRSYDKWTKTELNYLKELLLYKDLDEISKILMREPNIILNKVIRKNFLEYSVKKQAIEDDGVEIPRTESESKDHIRDIVILANSIKHNGRCIAGKDIRTGEWVRVVPLNDSKAFTEDELYELFGDRKGPKLLSVISIAFSNKIALNYHPEDEYIKFGSKWAVKDLIGNINDIDRLVDTFDWVSILTQIIGKPDRIPVQYFDTHRLNNSLQWIKLDEKENHPVIMYQYKLNKDYYRPRLCFNLKGYDYDLAVTYPEYKILNSDPGLIPLGNCYIAIGLSEGYEDGYHYKLVVGVVPISKGG